MAFPRLPARARRTPLWRIVALDFAAAVGIGITTAVVSSLLPAVARREQMEPMGLAILAAAPFLANLAGAFAGQLGPRTPRQLAVSRALGAVFLVVPVVLPIPPVIVAVTVGFWLTISFGVPLQLRLWGEIYPLERRSGLVGLVGAGRAGAAGIAAVGAGAFADRFGGVTVIAVAAIIAAACAIAAAGLPSTSSGDHPTYSALSSLRTLRSKPMLRRVALAQAFYGGGLIAAVPLYVLVYVDRLELSLTEIGLIGIFAAVAMTVGSVVWGFVADRLGGVAVMRGGSVLGFASLLTYVASPGLGILCLAAIAAGLASAAIDIGLQATMSQDTTLEERPAAMAGWNAFTGARGIVAPIAMSALVQAGVLDLSGGLVVCALATAVGTWLYLSVHVERRAPDYGLALESLADHASRGGLLRMARSAMGG